ncbi:MAG: TonB-dependent receptor [Acidobacteriota bacterium]
MVALVLLIILSAGLMAQSGSGDGNVYGRVVDEQGSGLPGATATLSGSNAPQVTTSDNQGNFRFLNVAPGRYSVLVTLPGFTKVTQENVVVTLGRNTEFRVELRLSTVQEAVTVTSETPLIDTRKTETGSSFSNAELQQIPTARDVWVMMQQVPGVLVDRINVAGNQSASQADFVGKGSYQSTYIYDGVNITDNGANGFSSTYFDFDSFQELQIATGGSDLTLNTAGVAINMVTKRGTNDLKGSARFLYAPNQWQSNNTPGEVTALGTGLSTSFNSNRTRFIREEGLEAGGPIIRDRAWLWAAASRQDVNLNVLGQSDVAGNPLHNDSTLETWNGKLNLQATPADAITILYNRNEKLVNGRSAGPQRPQETTFNQRGPTTLVKLDDSHVFSPSLIASAFFAYIDEPYSLLPLGGLDKQVFFDENAIPHNSYRYTYIKRPQHQINTQGSKFFNTGKIGHELKFGFGYRHTISESYSAWPGDQVFGSASSGVAAITRPADTKFKMNYYDAFVGDTLTMDRLTVNAGLRYDYQQGANLPSAVGANPTFPDVLPAVTYAGDKGYPITYRNFEPRVGVTYAIGPQRKTLVRASYARFVDQLRNTIYQTNAFPRIGGLYYGWNDANRDNIVQRSEVDLTDFQGLYNRFDPRNAPVPPSRIAANYKAPTTDELIFGMDHELFPGFAVSAAYTYRYITNLERSPYLGASASDYIFGAQITGTATAANGSVLNFSEPYYKLALGHVPTGNLYANQPDAFQRYHGVEVQVVKRLSDRWMVRGTFGYNDWRQYLSQQSIFNPNNLLGGTNDNGGLAVPSDSSNPFYDAKWQFNVSGLYQLPFGVNLGANYFGRQGYSNAYYFRVRTRVGSNDFTPATRFNVQIGQVGDVRLDNVYQLDLRLEKVVTIGPANITVSLACYNTLNGNAITSRENRVGDVDERTNRFVQYSLFNTPLAVQSPRIFQIGGRLSF